MLFPDEFICAIMLLASRNAKGEENKYE